MAQIIKFPSTSYAPLEVRNGERHAVSVWVTDAHYPEETRWHMQWPIQRAASFSALRGFNNDLARRQKRHRFKIGRIKLVSRFLLDIEPLVASGRVVVEIDGVRVNIARRKRA